jgi:hypothetical protein
MRPEFGFRGHSFWLALGVQARPLVMIAEPTWDWAAETAAGRLGGAQRLTLIDKD